MNGFGIVIKEISGRKNPRFAAVVATAALAINGLTSGQLGVVFIELSWLSRQMVQVAEVNDIVQRD